MTFTHDDIQARLIEFLYGELDGDVRAAFDAHIGACEACRREVSEFQQTRATARAVVRAPLGEPVPAAVRARVMEVAKRATAERAAAARGVGTTSRWLAWLRARWALPMLTTVAAMGALLLFRETLFREARRPLSDTAVEELRPKPAAVPTAGEAHEIAAAPHEPAVPAEGSRREPPPRRERPAVKDGPADKVRPASKGGKKTMTPARAKADSVGFGAGGLGRSENKGSVDQLLGKMRTEKPAGSAAAKDESAKPEGGSLYDSPGEATSGSQRRQRPQKQEEEEQALAKSARDDFKAERDEGRGAGFAQPPPPPAARKPTVATTPPPAAAAPVASAPRAPAPRAPAPSAASARVAAEAAPAAGPSGNERSAASPAAAEAPASVSREETGEEESKEKSAAKKSKVRAKSSEPSASPATPAADPAAILVDRAEKLMTARHFAAAAAAYKDLLQRFPQHAAVSTWRRRLSAAQIAAAQEQNQSGESGFAAPPPPR